VGIRHQPNHLLLCGALRNVRGGILLLARFRRLRHKKNAASGLARRGRRHRTSAQPLHFPFEMVK
jgi:hypothetical protein